MPYDIFDLSSVNNVTNRLSPRSNTAWLLLLLRLLVPGTPRSTEVLFLLPVFGGGLKVDTGGGDFGVDGMTDANGSPLLPVPTPPGESKCA